MLQHRRFFYFSFFSSKVAFQVLNYKIRFSFVSFIKSLGTNSIKFLYIASIITFCIILTKYLNDLLYYLFANFLPNNNTAIFDIHIYKLEISINDIILAITYCHRIFSGFCFVIYFKSKHKYVSVFYLSFFYIHCIP